MNTNLTQVDLFNLIASIVMVVCFGLFLAIVIFAAIFFKKDTPGSEEQPGNNEDPVEYDLTEYPDDEDSVIFR
jgi:hypothetical protein